MRIRLNDPNALKRILLLKGFSQRQFASVINVSHPYFNQIVNGERYPSGKIAKKIVDQLEVEFNDIFFIEVVNNIKQ